MQVKYLSPFCSLCWPWSWNSPTFQHLAPQKTFSTNLPGLGKGLSVFPNLWRLYKPCLRLTSLCKFSDFLSADFVDRGKRKYSSFCIVDCGKRNDTFCAHSSQCQYQQDGKHASSYFVLLPWLSQKDPWRGMLGGRATLNTFNTTGNNNGNNNNILFMAPHFIRAQSPYKDGSIIMFITHTCTNTHAQTHTQVGIMGRKQQISMQKRTCLATSNNLLLML